MTTRNVPSTTDSASLILFLWVTPTGLKTTLTIFSDYRMRNQFSTLARRWNEIDIVALTSKFVEALKGRNKSTLSEKDINSLAPPIQGAEMKQVVDGMAPYKAPGPNGLHAVFYQKFWAIVSGNIVDLVKLAFESGVIPEGLNHSLITLIPKVPNPKTINQFRSISLCNVSMKVISKVLMNRLRPLLPKLIALTQSSFIPGRVTNKNIIITQEILHSMRKKKGRIGHMAIKLDLEKACARLIGIFSRQFLRRSTFLITTRSSLLWNGERTKSFKPGRGLRQGDLLSLYLFVLCIERLSHMIQKRVENREWKPVKAARSAPYISHLFFANDLILFAEASIRQMEIIMECFEDFCGASGQCISFTKSKLYVSPNCSRQIARDISNVSKIPLTMDLGQVLLKKGLKWVLGDGRTVRFWFDVWIGETPLCNVVSIPISDEESERTVAELLWKMSSGIGRLLVILFILI
ncbi:hypothetical protein HHK36_001373 [Tetracentron sinense]|uniref:Reverse transcriptase domain-containing protein n=1 Tax=Tetracentron sinense TaxID=13715 RepID=A0A835A3J8_TETSI|nr:hypothetical protein HHK36_001373 [Tetracentron sinense]